MLILLFNIGGYRIAISFLQKHSSQKLEAQIDQRDYDESELVEIKVSLNMPYQERYTEFERHYGEIEIDGKAYTYVERKIEGDVAIFKCIANESKAQLQEFRNDLTRANSNNDIDHSQSKQNIPSVKNAVSEFEEHVFADMSAAIGILTSSYSRDNISNLPHTVINTPHQPPEFV